MVRVGELKDKNAVSIISGTGAAIPAAVAV
jgi:hypothetical protein